MTLYDKGGRGVRQKVIFVTKGGGWVQTPPNLHDIIEVQSHIRGGFYKKKLNKQGSVLFQTPKCSFCEMKLLLILGGEKSVEYQDIRVKRAFCAIFVFSNILSNFEKKKMKKIQIFLKKLNKSRRKKSRILL